MIDNQLQKTDTRRGFVTKVFGGAAALAIAGAVVGGGFASPVSAGTAYFKTTTSLNLRSQANTTSAVILVIPQGGQVMQVGPDLNGFKKISYSGKTGYAYSQYLVPASGGDMPAYRGAATTTASVNMRSGAGGNYSIVRVIPQGATIEVYDEYANYYWLVRYQGQFGYVHSNYMNPSGGGQQSTFKTATTNLNLRSEPSLAGQILKFIPAGTQVAVGDQFANGYRSVTYAGVSGWASTTYLQ